MASVGGSASPCPGPGTLYRQAESIFGEAPKPDALRKGHVVKGGPEVPGRVLADGRKRPHSRRRLFL